MFEDEVDDALGAHADVPCLVCKEVLVFHPERGFVHSGGGKRVNRCNYCGAKYSLFPLLPACPKCGSPDVHADHDATPVLGPELAGHL